MTSKQYRKSSYVISAQVDTDKYVMLHGYSGAMDIVDKNIVLDLERHTFFDECLLCECALFCGGGCLAKSKIHCTQMKGFVENAIRKIYKQKFIKTKNYE